VGRLVLRRKSTICLHCIHSYMVRHAQRAQQLSRWQRANPDRLIPWGAFYRGSTRLSTAPHGERDACGVHKHLGNHVSIRGLEFGVRACVTCETAASSSIGFSSDHPTAGSRLGAWSWGSRVCGPLHADGRASGRGVHNSTLLGRGLVRRVS
jgi:hypothetical protein